MSQSCNNEVTCAKLREFTSPKIISAYPIHIRRNSHVYLGNTEEKNEVRFTDASKQRRADIARSFSKRPVPEGVERRLHPFHATKVTLTHWS
ncbi:hypothetical protein GWI33_020137 [Rhynchophorus ferrugineus]|uniref:Uncharacterized protein n=1 Tax=Rhynchophorus ferrugineus TaxID=354439 RepID=A0A834HQ74_RHYFE|nr:hypothetical protein GWI33_020137 [Rhynchophorus ferrugineus]